MTGGSHPRHRLDEVLSSPLRLSIASALAAAEKAEFRAVRDAVEVSDSLLSKQVALLEQAGYLDVRKGRAGRRPLTWLLLNTSGRQALAAHVAALDSITQGHRVADEGGASVADNPEVAEPPGPERACGDTPARLN